MNSKCECVCAALSKFYAVLREICKIFCTILLLKFLCREICHENPFCLEEYTNNNNLQCCSDQPLCLLVRVYVFVLIFVIFDIKIVTFHFQKRNLASAAVAHTHEHLPEKQLKPVDVKVCL